MSNQTISNTSQEVDRNLPHRKFKFLPEVLSKWTKQTPYLLYFTYIYLNIYGYTCIPLIYTCIMRSYFLYEPNNSLLTILYINICIYLLLYMHTTYIHMYTYETHNYFFLAKDYYKFSYKKYYGNFVWKLLSNHPQI